MTTGMVATLPGCVDECLLNIGGRLGRGLHEDEAVFPRKGLPLLPLHVPSRLQITAPQQYIIFNFI